jgi:hypothetical protein
MLEKHHMGDVEMGYKTTPNKQTPAGSRQAF